MKFGLHWHLPCFENQTPVQRYRELLEEAVHGEALGFESAWPVEQHFNAHLSITPAPLLLLAALAARTQNLRLGVAILLLPLWQPLRIAEEAAVLDVISNGRVEFGLGRGSVASYFRGFGIPQEESHARFLEALDLITQAWTRHRVSFKGQFFAVDNLSVVPKPVQQPHPPIRIACNNRETFEMMGRLGYPIFAASQVNSFKRITEFLGLYREGRRAAGHAEAESKDVTLLVPLHVGESVAKVREIMEPSVTHFLNATATLFKPEDTRPEMAGPHVRNFAERVRKLSYERVSELMAIFETPEVCVERLSKLREDCNMGRVICWFNAGGLVPHAQVMRSMELFAAKVMPHLT